MTTPITRLAVRAGLALFALGLIETFSWGAGAALTSRALLYEPPRALSMSAYLSSRDPELGWPSHSQFGTGEYDRSGSRVVPAFPDPDVAACVSIYGDSYAWAEEVSPEQAWGNVLSRALGCRVSNFGVPGYGVDQAYLRYARAAHDRAPVVVLTHLSENVLRSVNRMRNLLAPSAMPAFKPRFVIGPSGGLTLVPIFTPRDETEFREVLAHPDRLGQEWFAPGGPAGVVVREPPYVLSTLRVFGHDKLRAALAGRPSHAAFYEPSHPARAVDITLGIAERFVQDAHARGAAPVVVLIPLVPDFGVARSTGRWPHAPLVDRLTRAHVPFVDLGPAFEADLAGADPCSLYVRCTGGHLNARGNQLMAEHVRVWIEASGHAGKGAAE